MTTVLIYVLLTAVVAAALYALSVFVFGRSEMLPPVAKGSSVTALPEGPISGADIRALRFGMSVRGYTMAEVDWALAEAAEEIDRLRAALDSNSAVSANRAGKAATR